MLNDIGSKGAWDIKHERGGLVEIEFIAQYLQIVHAAKNPQILAQNTFAGLAALAENHLLATEDARLLEQACRLYHRLTQLLRLCITGDFRPDEAIPGLRQLLSSAAGAPDLQRTEALLADTQVQVARLFDRILGRP
jgi:glutamate-ammonia-ligase adenylyltransferase